MAPPPTFRTAYTAQLQQVLGSRAFRNTEVLKRLLEYLGQRALAGETQDLKEYTVGVEAFGKAVDYDPKTDSSVRVQAGKLRQKLEEYYRTEGSGDAVLIDLPKGHFTLEFHERSGSSGLLSPVRTKGPSFSRAWLIAAAAVVWAIIASFAVFRSRPQQAVSERYSSPDLTALWSPFLTASRPTVVSLGTPLFAKISGDFFRSPVLNSPKTFGSSSELKTIEKDLDGKAIPAYPYTGIGEAAGAFELARLFVSKHRDLNLILSSSLTWDDIARNDVIFVGPPKFNLHESDLPVRQDFIIRHGRLENLHPREGEPNSFTETWSPDQSQLLQGYALVARLPGLHGAGYMMLLASTSTEGTRAAVEYVTRPEYASQLVHSLRPSAPGVPKYFEAVVRAKFQSQTPIQIEQVIVHVLR